MAVGKEHYRIWHNTSTCGPFGSAMAAADLLGLDEEQAVWALGNAGTQSSGLWEFLAAGAMSKHLHTARGAESGLLAELLAREGFTGSNRILEGEKGFFAGLCPDPHPEAITADPGRPWQLTNTSMKPWPCCRHTHPLIDAAIELHGKLGGAEIRKVTVGAYRAALDVCDRPRPQDPYSAKFSLQHCAAIALTDGKVVQSSFDTAARQRVAPQTELVEVGPDPAVDEAYPKAWGVRLAVEAADGRALEASRRHAKGDPENPVTAAELSEKALMLLVEGGMREDRARGLIDTVRDLPSGRRVGDLALFSRGTEVDQAPLARSA
jgi:2-methylcitrate dehydratase PrpD